MTMFTLNFVVEVTLLLLTVPHFSSAQKDGSVLPLAVAGTVAGILFVVLVFICAIIICRQRSRYKKAAPKQNILTIVGDEMENSFTLQTKVSSLGTENRADYWSNTERRGQQTEEKVRRMNIADNFEELGRYAPPHAPPPPILRSVGFDMKERSATNANGALVTDASRGSQPETMRVSAVSAASAAVIYHNPNPPEPLDLLDQPSTSYDPKPEYAPVIRETGDHDGMEAVGVKTPNPLNFQTPEEDGFYRLQVE